MRTGQWCLGRVTSPDFEVLCSRMDEWLGDDDLKTNPLRLAIGRLNRLMDGPSTVFADAVIDLSIGLEATLSGSDTSDVSLRLRTRAADLLAATDDPGNVIYDDVKALYGLRSGIVHGSVLKPSKLTRLIGSVSSAERACNPGEQVALVLDRWRDLLRRAILARARLLLSLHLGLSTVPSMSIACCERNPSGTLGVTKFAATGPMLG